LQIDPLSRKRLSAAPSSGSPEIVKKSREGCVGEIFTHTIAQRLAISDVGWYFPDFQLPERTSV
jgi:hypothetical protein